MPARSGLSASKTKDSTATIGFEAKLWLLADKLGNNMDAAERDRLPQAARRVSAGARINTSTWCWG